MQKNVIYNQDSAIGLKQLDDESIDCVITSPPYDNLRSYNGFTFDFNKIANELYRVIKKGGLIVWIVSDATINGSETGSSFTQVLYFKQIGFNIHDTMIWEKESFTFPDEYRYRNTFEYMFILSKGKPKSFNPISDKVNKWAGHKIHGTSRNWNGNTFIKSNTGSEIKEIGVRNNIWKLNSVKKNDTGHPAPYPVELVIDHILSWTNKGDIVLDPFMGSGTTAIACIQTHRQYIGFEISKEYVDMANKRIMKEPPTLDVWD